MWVSQRVKNEVRSTAPKMEGFVIDTFDLGRTLVPAHRRALPPISAVGEHSPPTPSVPLFGRVNESPAPEPPTPSSAVVRAAKEKKGVSFHVSRFSMLCILSIVCLLSVTDGVVIYSL